MLSIHEICQATGGRFIGKDSSFSIDSFHFDTRLLTPGSMFVALTGGTRDGHLFLKDAEGNGAIAALVSNENFVREDSLLSYIVVADTQKAFADIAKYYRKKLRIPIVAITGSNGKTTTKDIIAHVLGFKQKVFKTFKNYNNHLGLPLSLLQIQPEHKMAVLEMGMNHAGEIDFLASISKPDVSVIVNVTDAHIEHLGSRENIAKAKGELLPHTSKDGFAILNGDNPFVRGIAHLNPGRTFFYSLEQPADISASDIHSDDQGTSFTVHLGHDHFTCVIPMFGSYNVANALPAIFIAHQYGYSKEDIRAALSTLSISPMRFELMREIEQTLIINDAYNASPTSMKSSIQTFSGILPGYKKWLVLGDMFELGEQSASYHHEVGEFIESLSAQFEGVVTVGETSRFISSAVSSIPTRHFAEKQKAAHFLQQYADEKHAFLIKASRGMKLEELIKIMMAGQ